MCLHWWWQMFVKNICLIYNPKIPFCAFLYYLKSILYVFIRIRAYWTYSCIWSWQEHLFCVILMCGNFGISVCSHMWRYNEQHTVFPALLCVWMHSLPQVFEERLHRVVVGSRQLLHFVFNGLHFLLIVRDFYTKIHTNIPLNSRLNA